MRYVLSNKEDMHANRHEIGPLRNDPVQPTHDEIANPLCPPHPFETLNKCIVAVVRLVNM